MTFFERYDKEWANLLGLRRESFRKAFDFLAANRPRGHLFVETGCTRKADNWDGDGQSTFLFDRFAGEYGGQVFSVDNDPRACAFARSIVGPATTVTTDDSVRFLYRLGRDLAKAGRQIDLLYLDSLDCNPANPAASEIHHLMELCAIAPALKPGTLVMVDDSFHVVHGTRSVSGNFNLLRDLGIGGKAACVAKYFKQIGVPTFFEGYQCGWVIGD